MTIPLQVQNATGINGDEISIFSVLYKSGSQSYYSSVVSNYSRRGEGPSTINWKDPILIQNCW